MKSFISLLSLPISYSRCGKLIYSILLCILGVRILKLSLMQSAYLQLFFTVTLDRYLIIDTSLISIPMHLLISHIQSICAWNCFRKTGFKLLLVQHQLLVLDSRMSKRSLDRCFLWAFRLRFILFFIVKFFILYITNHKFTSTYQRSILLTEQQVLTLTLYYLFIIMYKYFLLLLLLSTSTSTSIVIGGYSQVSKQKEEHSKVVEFIKRQIPILLKWNVQSLDYQVVNGINYRAILKYTGNVAQIIVYSSFGGQMKVTSFLINQQPQTIPDITDGDKQNTAAMSGDSKRVCDVYQKLNLIRRDNMLVGAYQSLPLNSTQKQQAWKQTLKVYPSFVNYTLLQVRRQVVAGINYILIAQSEAKDKVIVVKLFKSLAHDYNARIVQTNTAIGFTSQEIVEFYHKCIELKPDLANYQLSLIQNWGNSGLRLVYSLQSSKIVVNCKYEQDQSMSITFT